MPLSILSEREAPVAPEGALTIQDLGQPLDAQTMIGLGFLVIAVFGLLAQLESLELQQEERQAHHGR